MDKSSKKLSSGGVEWDHIIQSERLLE